MEPMGLSENWAYRLFYILRIFRPYNEGGGKHVTTLAV